MRATERAARIQELAPRARAPAFTRARLPGRSRERRGSARCRRIVSRLPYISSRAQGSGTGGGPYGTSPALPRPSRSTGGGGGVSPPPQSPAPRPDRGYSLLFCSLYLSKWIAHWGAQKRRQADAARRLPDGGVTLERGPGGPLEAEGNARYLQTLGWRRELLPAPRAYFLGLASCRSGASGEVGWGQPNVHHATWWPLVLKWDWSPATASSPSGPFHQLVFLNLDRPQRSKVVRTPNFGS